ncbi:hypothetical protein CL634_06325, partial [bacterium]|nr:hypothetical protein [bacterium]
MADITIKLTGSNKQIENAILKLFNDGVSNAVKSAAPDIERETAILAEKALRESPELKDLIEGDLRGQMGLSSRRASSAVETIIKSISSTIKVTSKKTKLRSKGSAQAITIEAQPTHFRNLTSIPQGTQRYFSSRYTRMVDLKWLDWLLLEGDRIIVGKFYFEGSGKGRSGLGTMKSGGSFRIPPRYSGTAANNFVTRAFNKNQFQS